MNPARLTVWIRIPGLPFLALSWAKLHYAFKEGIYNDQRFQIPASSFPATLHNKGEDCRVLTFLHRKYHLFFKAD